MQKYPSDILNFKDHRILKSFIIPFTMTGISKTDAGRHVPKI